MGTGTFWFQVSPRGFSRWDAKNILLPQGEAIDEVCEKGDHQAGGFGRRCGTSQRKGVLRGAYPICLPIGTTAVASTHDEVPAEGNELHSCRLPPHTNELEVAPRLELQGLAALTDKPMLKKRNASRPPSAFFVVNTTVRTRAHTRSTRQPKMDSFSPRVVSSGICVSFAATTSRALRLDTPTPVSLN